MDLFNTNEEHYWRNMTTRIILILFTVSLIVWFLPRNKGVQFHYELGKPWTYNAFIANFDFPIYKTDDAIKSEKDSIITEFQPYYNFTNSVETIQINKFKNDYKNGIPGVPSIYMSVVVDRLHRLYKAGIMSTPEYNKLSKDSLNMIRIVDGKEARSIKINEVFSTLTAYEHLLRDEKLETIRLMLQRCNLNEYIEPNMVFDKDRSDTEKNDLLSGIAIASGMVISGQKVIDRGEMVNDYTYRVLSSFEREMKRRTSSTQETVTTIIGQALYVLILVVLFTTYLALFRKDYFQKPRSVAMLYSTITLFPILVSLMMEHYFLSVYILPFAMASIFIRVFMDSRTAFTAHMIMVLICAIAVKYQYEFVLIQIISGFVAVYSLRELTRRAQVFKTAILVTLTSSAVYVALQLIQNDALEKMDESMFVMFAINGVLLLLSYPLMYIIEKTFGFTSNVTLFELSNTNKGILRDLSETAPGTFQHSITVGNLAAEIANRIGANSLLVRTGALYHDIGKMANPVFFTENQSGINPHDKISCLDSAKIITGHVTEGVKLAETNSLPQFIKDFILTHHGTGMAKYFYIKYKNSHLDEEVDKEPFSYPGPNPFTREQAILMMADSAEAASHSLTEYTEDSISDIVNKVIDEQVSSGCFVDCPITFRDIKQAKQILAERLKAIYHTRISYPELKKEEVNNDKE